MLSITCQVGATSEAKCQGFGERFVYVMCYKQILQSMSRLPCPTITSRPTNSPTHDKPKQPKKRFQEIPIAPPGQSVATLRVKMTDVMRSMSRIALNNQLVCLLGGVVWLVV
ncbi:X-ray radiation resistance-associated protein 1 isoform 1 [Anopheles sinensis]|uniref:X-ray radiation resistance-associated protein 1 isoform 1 n=1 Tax=Anopheles sinensis TaxID=74873 RepID=A0A084VBF2_ANOSI|nr:X-ray radiation resistance-associated protein 1 isoform 1 [Anopheles sinensis]